MKRFGHRSHVGGSARFLGGGKKSTGKIQDKLQLHADRLHRIIALEGVTDVDGRVIELRKATVALLRLLERPSPALKSWHEKVAAAVKRVNELYPTEATV